MFIKEWPLDLPASEILWMFVKKIDFWALPRHAVYKFLQVQFRNLRVNPKYTEVLSSMLYRPREGKREFNFFRQKESVFIYKESENSAPLMQKFGLFEMSMPKTLTL